MRRSRLVACHATPILFLAALLCVPMWGANPAQPGSINYVEGQVAIGNRHLDRTSVGSVSLDAGQSITTGKGKVEILLTPGVFLRVDDQSSATMVSPGLADTEVRLAKGRAMVEVDEIHKENNLRIDEDGASARLLKNGLYDFDANQGEARVFGGQAIVQEHGRQIKVKAGHELLLTDSTKAQRFDKHSAEDSFYRWSSLRSDYLAEANADAARYYYQGGFAWLGGSWYWDPWFGAYTFVPGSGLLYSPFGWAYYSPWWGYEPPFFTYGRAFHHFGHDFDHYRGNRRAVIPGNGFTPDLRRSFGRAPMRQGEPHLSPRLFSAGRGFHGLGQRR